jgi:hypothetical protein
MLQFVQEHPSLVHGTCQFPLWMLNPLSISVFNRLPQE